MCFRLLDVVHCEKHIYLVFEYMDLDLKKYINSCPDYVKDSRIIKVSFAFLLTTLQAVKFYILPCSCTGIMTGVLFTFSCTIECMSCC
ncbi:putative protein-serine/threonine kinase [Dioscorea sansibarensis]